jgi:hypothetical protein
MGKGDKWPSEVFHLCSKGQVPGALKHMSQNQDRGTMGPMTHAKTALLIVWSLF